MTGSSRATATSTECMPCCDEATTRLHAEFGCSVTHAMVSDAVLQSYRILRRGSAPEGALPELVERLARLYLTPDPQEP